MNAVRNSLAASNLQVLKRFGIKNLAKFRKLAALSRKEQEHIRLELVDPVTNFTHNGIAFNQASKFELVKSGKPFDIVFTIEENTFSKNNIQLLVKDIRESESNNIAAVLSLLIRNTKDDADVIGGMTTNPEM